MEAVKVEKVEADLEKSIEVLHADIRSIKRQIEARKIGADYADDPVLQKSLDDVWLSKAESSIRRKLAQARFLERDLGALRRAEYGDIEKYYYITIMIRIAKLAMEYDSGFDEYDIDEDWLPIRAELQHLNKAAANLFK